jgi:hypothetical protein
MFRNHVKVYDIVPDDIRNFRLRNRVPESREVGARRRS